MELINNFKKYLSVIIPKMVYKSSSKAKKYETMESRNAGDAYVSAILNTDSLITYKPESISSDILNQVGIYDENLIGEIQKDILKLPEKLWDKVVELKRKDIIANFVETNNYYRMLNGQPNMDSDFIYIEPRVLNTYGYYDDLQEDYDNDELDKLTPLHELPSNIVLLMEQSGYLDKLYDNYTSNNYDVEYIKYIGSRKIDIISARTASQYELLYIPSIDGISTRFIRDFSTYYEEARQYFLNNIYNFHFNNEYSFYEGYIGFFILVMAIQRTINSMFEVVIERDFYDIETCRMFLEAYGVPFIESFTFNQQLNLVKNLNILLMNKCTNKVLYDILGLLEYDSYELTKLLLVKQHKTRKQDELSEPKPIFLYKTVLSKEGIPRYELDKSLMYDYYFVAVPMDEIDTKLVEDIDPDAIKYDDVTANDEYWIEDSELIQKLQNDEINFVETKYTNVAITIRMYQTIFEHIYLQKIMLDKKSDTSKILVRLPLILDIDISVVELEVLLICLLCKYHNMSPDLLDTPSKQLSVLGFNFDADFEAIKKDIISKPNIYSKELIDYVKDMTLKTTSDVNKMYYNVRTLSDILIKGMESTQDEQVYHAYKKLYQVLFITDVHNELFTLKDGTQPETYMDWLKEYQYPLYEFVDNLKENEILDKINYITLKMINLFQDTKYLNQLTPTDTTVINSIIKILRWFKSYTMDIKDFDIIYLFDSKYYNMMKMMSRMYFHENMTIRQLDIGYNDLMIMSERFNIKEVKSHKDILRMSSEIKKKEVKPMRDSIIFIR